MAHKAHNIGVANQIGKYSDAVETAPNLRWLHTQERQASERTSNSPRTPRGNGKWPGTTS
jgi:hypothetical protein